MNYETAQDYFHDQIYLPLMKAFREGDEETFVELVEFAGHKFVESNAFAKGFENYVTHEKGISADPDMPIDEFFAQYVQPYMEKKEWGDCDSTLSDMGDAESGHGFGFALGQLKKGAKVTRLGWNGKGQFVFLVPADRYLAKTDAAKGIAGKDGRVAYRAYLALKTAQGDIATWVPSISDCLAEDWAVAE